jgi:hypothetical protein
MRLYVSIANQSPVSAALNGSVLVLIQFDVCEELRLDRLRSVREGTIQQKPGITKNSYRERYGPPKTCTNIWWTNSPRGVLSSWISPSS